MEEIRGVLAKPAGVPAFDARHPELKPADITIAGPFENRVDAAHHVGGWAWSQPAGSFKVRSDGSYPAVMSRGRQFRLRCKNVDNHKCQFKLVYEQGDDDRYHLVNADLSHGEECRKPDATPAENLAAGNFMIPPELLETGVQLKASNMSTAQVNRFLLHRAGEASLAVTWTWKHLDRALAREMEKTRGVPGGGSDVGGVLEWLHERNLSHGLFSDYTTDEEGRLTRLYYVVDGAAEAWKRTSGMSIALFDTTHSTNKYDMRLGCFTSRNEDRGMILLAVSLVKREDARSFSWVFGKFKESFASAPDVLLTDGDTGIAAAAKSVFPGTRHLLCTWHISQNLKTHALKLFPVLGGGGARPDKNENKRTAFRHAFKNIMLDGGPGLEEPDAYFESQWEVLLAKARVDGALACPASVDVNSTAVYDAAYESAAEELDDALEDGDVEIKVHKRGRGRPKKEPAEQVWEWLATMYAVRGKWARVHTRETQSRGNFTSNIAESWHAQLKRHLGNTNKLLPLVMHLDAQRKLLDGNRAVKRSVRIRDHELQRAQHPPLLESVRTSVSPGAFDYLLQEYRAAQPMRAALAESTAPTEPARYHVLPGVLKKKNPAVVATTRTCSARCEWNHGLPCRHILRVYMAENSETLDVELIHPFWREGNVSEDDSEDDEEYQDAPEAVEWEAGEVAVSPADAGPCVPPKHERYRSIMTACKPLCDVGKRNKNAYLDVVGAVERLIGELDLKHSKPGDRADGGGVDPATGAVVFNPSQPKNGRGRRQKKRQRGALGA